MIKVVKRFSYNQKFVPAERGEWGEVSTFAPGLYKCTNYGGSGERYLPLPLDYINVQICVIYQRLHLRNRFANFHQTS